VSWAVAYLYIRDRTSVTFDFNLEARCRVLYNASCLDSACAKQDKSRWSRALLSSPSTMFTLLQVVLRAVLVAQGGFSCHGDSTGSQITCRRRSSRSGKQIGFIRLARPSVTILRPKCCTLVVPHHFDFSLSLAGHSSACGHPIGKRHPCDVIWLRQALGQCKPSSYTAYSAFRDYISHSCTSVIATRVLGSAL
jgi:hypothetical protein